MSFIRDTFLPPSPLAADSGRIAFVDLAKGICIILVILLHTTNLRFVGGSQLRLPLYFTLSGLFLHDYRSFFSFATKKFNKLIVPFLFFSSFYIVIHIVAEGRLTAHDLFHIIALPKGPIWFLEALFWANIFTFLVIKYIRNSGLRLITIIALCILGHNLYDGRILGIGHGMVASVFVYFGYLLSQIGFLRHNKTDKYALILGLAILSTGVAIAYAHNDPWLYFLCLYYLHGHPLLFWLISPLMVTGALLISKYVVWLPFISYVGRYSLIMLGAHAVLVKASGNLYEYVGGPYAYAVIVILLCWLSIPVFLKYLPYFCAQKDLIRIKEKDRIANNYTASITK